MIFVFDVISGKFLGIEQNETLFLVSDLRGAIDRITGLQANNQILLVSGGQVPMSEHHLSMYDVGSEDNPYFLFARPALMANSADLGRSFTPQEDVVPSSTPGSGTHLLNTAEQLVHAQHLQHQGWQAAVGNLSDVTSNVRNAAGVLRRKIESLQLDESRLTSVESVSVEEDGAAVEDVLHRLEISANIANQLPLPKSMKRDSVVNLANLLHRLTGMTANSVKEELENTNNTLKDAFALLETYEKWVTESERTDMREIMGLTDRLGHLDTLLNNARIHCAGGGISTSPPRFSGASSPPSNLVSRPLSDVVARCAAAAAELRSNLNLRVEWLSHVQSRLARCAAQFVITSASIRRRQKVVKNTLIYLSAPPFYVKLAIAQHTCKSTLFKSCVPCPVHSEVEMSPDSHSLDSSFTHPLSTLFCNKQADSCNKKRNSVFDSADGTSTVFTAADLDAINEAAPFVFADQQSKFSRLDKLIDKAEQLSDVIKLNDLNDLAVKLKSIINKDHSAIQELRQSLNNEMKSTSNYFSVCSKAIQDAIGQVAELETDKRYQQTEKSIKPEKQDVGIVTEDSSDRPASGQAYQGPSSDPSVPVVPKPTAPAQATQGRSQARINISLTGISTGDLVIVTWSEELEQPVILTISPVPHLIHQDSINELALATPQNPILSWVSSGELVLGQSSVQTGNSTNRPSWFRYPNHYRLAEVVEKQHCQVKRETNRYRLALNTRFYRLRVRLVNVEPAISSAISSPSLNTVGLNINLTSGERRPSVDSDQVPAGTSP